MTWNWDKIDELVASFARPYSMYVCSSAIAFAAIWSVVAAHETALITIPAAAGLAGGQAYLRSLDKQTAATASTTDKQTAAGEAK